MKKYLITLTCLLFATAMYCSSLAYAGNIPGSTETDDGIDPTIKCYCSYTGENKNCTSSNNGNFCVPADVGVNIRCNNFNGNCFY